MAGPQNTIRAGSVAIVRGASPVSLIGTQLPCGQQENMPAVEGKPALAPRCRDGSDWSSRAEESHLRALPEPCVNLSIHTAPDVRPLAHAASGFASSTGSSRCQMASVGPWPRLNNAAPSVRPHYRTFVPTTGHSAPVLRIGTLVLAVLAA